MRLTRYLLVGILAIGFSCGLFAVKTSFERDVSANALDSTNLLLEWSYPDPDRVVLFYIYKLTGKSRTRLKDVNIAGGFVRPKGQTSKSFSYHLTDQSAFQKFEIEALTADGRVEVLQPELSSLAPQRTLNPNATRVSVKQSHASSRPFGVPDSSRQREIASMPGAKVFVECDGIFRLTRSELETAGFDLSGDPDKWQLFYQGREQAIIVGKAGSFIEFVGTGTDTPETSLSAYYLINGAEPGRRIKSKPRRRISPPVESRNFASEITRRSRFIYVTTVLNGSKGNYFGDVINAAGANIQMDLPGLDPDGGETEVEIVVQGLTQSQHAVSLVINGNSIGTLGGADRNSFSETFTVSSDQLNQAGNTIELNSNAGASDISLLDKIRIKYPRKFVAADGMLRFETQNYKKTVVRGFSDRTIRVLDVSEPETPKELSGIEVVDDSKNTHLITINSARRSKFIAYDQTALRSVHSIVNQVPSQLSDLARTAKMIIVTHGDWSAEAQQYADYRTNSGLSTEVVDIEDVYDEFSFGEKKADAINAFLEFAHTQRTTPPEYVLLLGDGTYDARNFEGNGDHNKIPVKLVDTLFEETASDEALADFDNDGLAEVAIGRIPVRSGADVTSVLQKVTSFENGIAGAPARGVVCASDLPDGYDFETLCGGVLGELPGSIPQVSINRADMNSKQTLLTEINAGKYFVNYSGHGTTAVWATTAFFGQTDVATLTNQDLSVFTMLTCLNGYFIRPVQDSLSEELLRTNTNGAVAVWSSSGSTTPDVQELMARRFYSQLGNSQTINRLGDLVNDAKASVSGGVDVRRSWVLLGDPALVVKPAQQMSK